MRHELHRVLKTPRGKELAKMTREQGLQREIHLMPHQEKSYSETPGQNIYIDPYFHPPFMTAHGIEYASTARLIGHELGHAITGAGRNEDPGGAMDNVLQNENPIVTHLNPPESERTQYFMP